MSEQQNPATSPVAPGTPVTDVDTAMRKDAGDRSGAWADTIAAGAKTRRK
ncbi:hypothetical protein [Amycolatopsis sp. PS_44_ISF1]|nr:hypothetical protein [Amycolatopsis sp. PS_44_ISF1]MDT8916252.1 hypothetical protein [Amycolatopsis sp. PS_44_ISF1]